MALVPGNLEEDHIPEANVRSSKKQRKGEEEWSCLGGMRPHECRGKNAPVEGDRGKNEEGMAQHGDGVQHSTVLDVPNSDGVTLKENTFFKSPLKEKMWNAWGRMARDPDTELVNFIRGGAPLGMAVEIPSSQGIFPKTEEGGEDEKDDGVEFDVVKGMLNYKSVTEQPDEAKIEIERNISKGFVLRMSWDEAAERFGAGTCSKLALILKEKPDGSTKRRLILDMKRSGGNDRASIPERIVLPIGRCDLHAAGSTWKEGTAGEEHHGGRCPST